MNNFIITEQQINYILSIIGEFPAKNVINSIDLLRNLPKKEDDKIENLDKL